MVGDITRDKDQGKGIFMDTDTDRNFEAMGMGTSNDGDKETSSKEATHPRLLTHVLSTQALCGTGKGEHWP